MRIFLVLMFLTLSNSHALDKNKMAPIGDTNNPKCFPYACENQEGSEIDVSQISIKNFRLRMSEQDLIKKYPKYIALPKQSGVLSKKYLCTDPRKYPPEKELENLSIDRCGVSIGMLHPYQVELSFYKNKLVEVNFYFYYNYQKTFDDLALIVSNKFGQSLNANTLSHSHRWELGYKNNDFQVAVKLEPLQLRSTTLLLRLIDNELINYENKLLDQEELREKEAEKNDLYNRRAKDI